MDRDPAGQLQALVTRLDPNLVDPVARCLDRLLVRPDATEALIVAVAGPSGVGKSELVNRIAGSRVVPVGPLRPTTASVAVWGEVPVEYLPGVRAVAAPPRSDLALVDMPAAEHFPEAVEQTLDLVDAAIFVVSPDRYADAVTVEALEEIDDAGVPWRLVLSASASDVSDLAVIVGDVERKLSAKVAATMTDDAGSVRSLLDHLVEEKGEILLQRDHDTAKRTAERALVAAEALGETAAAAREAYEQAGAIVGSIRVDRDDLADAADTDWDSAAKRITDLVAAASDEAVHSLRDTIADNRAAVIAVERVVESLPPIDPGAIEAWGSETEHKALAAMKRRRLHPRRAKIVRSEMWRLATDFGREPTKPVRKALRGRIPDLRIERHEALTEAIREAARGRVEPVLTALDPDRAVSPDDLRHAAKALQASNQPPMEAEEGTDA